MADRTRSGEARPSVWAISGWVGQVRWDPRFKQMSVTKIHTVSVRASIKRGTLTLRCCAEPSGRDSRSGRTPTSWCPLPVFFLPRPNNLPSADRSVDFFRSGESLLWVVCLLGTSLIIEYLTVLSTGFVALLAGGETPEGETPCGEVF